ncbi:hypothetical protein B296_00010601 [Ensete ventricosum]|uniref:Uncharacterized protein n=1 Tax=Ensete ventricosum TaxID=4639 RepID=A0A426YUP7_ENSVE|nr:hypothetical protein B296_00010601 [Ensete ventricosum]
MCYSDCRYSFQEQYAECEKLLLEERKKSKKKILLRVVLGLWPEKLLTLLWSLTSMIVKCYFLSAVKEHSDEVGRLQNLLVKHNDINENSLLTSPCTIPGISFTEMPKSSSTQKTPQLCEENGTQNQEAVFLTDDSYKVENKVVSE